MRRLTMFLLALAVLFPLTAWAQTETAPRAPGGTEATQPGPSGATAYNLKQIQSSLPVDQAISKLKQAADQNGMRVVAEVNQSSVLPAAKGGGAAGQIKAHTLLLEDPQSAHALLSANPAAVNAVATRVNVYQTNSGQTEISYIPPSDLLKSFNEPQVREGAPNLDRKLDTVVSSAVK